MRVLAAVLSLAAVLLLGPTLALAILAQEPAGTVFEGSHEAAGTVRFTVAPGGDQVVALELEGLAGGGCSWGTIGLDNWGGPIQIADGAFQATNPDGDTIAGRLIDPSHAEGTVMVSDPARGCQTPALRWVAEAP